MTLDAKIEAVLFWKGEPLSQKRLGEILNVTPEDIKSALIKLETRLEEGGLCLIRKESEIMIGTRKDASPLIEKLTKEELMRDLGRAGLETLSIVLYRGPVSRRDIDYIRGVNSTFILRNLMIRGLVEKIVNPDDQRGFLYKPTFELLQHLGITSLEHLPEFKEIQAEIESFKKSEEADSSETIPSAESPESE